VQRLKVNLKEKSKQNFQKKPNETSKQMKFEEKIHRAGTKARLIQRGLGYGGEINYRKVKRPFSSKASTHIVIRSRLLSGSRSLLKQNRREWCENLIRSKAKRHLASLYKFSVNSNHIHLLMKFKTPEQRTKFLRDLTGSLALKIKTSFKIKKGIQVWDARPFSRLVKKSAYPAAINYIEKNRNEAAGVWAYVERPVSELQKVLEKWMRRYGSKKIVLC